MSLIFPKWTNLFPTVFAMAALGGLTTVVGGFWYYATPKFWNVGYMPTQPGGGFNHRIHAGQLGMDCRYCHTNVEKSAEANIPNVATCYGCHADGRLAKLATSEVHKQKTEFVRTAYASDASIEWRRVHKVPDYVRNFPHDVHLNVGISCYSCHGQINTMPVVYQVESLSMSWCLDCHRAPEKHILEPQYRNQLTKLNWVADHLQKRNEQGAKNAAELVKQLHLQPPQNCGACHY